MSAITAKFGGSSLADAGQFRKVHDIIRADDKRRYIVVSAPGKRTSDDEKITDMLYACHKAAEEGGDYAAIFEKVARRYRGIVADLGLSLDLSDELNTILENLPRRNADYAASRGEYLSGLIAADYLGFPFLDPAKAVFFTADGAFDAERTQDVLGRMLGETETAVVPGFYGSLPDGAIKTFSRGGSDITGAIVARAAHAGLYENWSDVSGFLMADPRIVENPEVIATITYHELRELAYMGASVFHEEAIFPVRREGIPIHIKNTNDPAARGTLIAMATDESAQRGAITGIAGRKGFCVIAIEKAMMNSEMGFGRRVLTVLESFGISFEHLPTGIDTMSVVVSEQNLGTRLPEVLAAIRETCQPDSIHVEYNLALIATVGRGMVRYPGTAARLFKALAGADVNVRMIDQGSSEINIIVGVESADFEKALRAIYGAFR